MSTTTEFAPDALVLRTTDRDGLAYGGFAWPREVGAIVIAPDWEATTECGHGLHGLIDGSGNWSYLSDSSDALWWIVEVMRSECIEIDGDKVKFPRCRVKYVGAPGAAIIEIMAIRRELETRNGLALIDRLTKDATTGEASPSATTGEASPSATTGVRSPSATTGVRSPSATTGVRSPSATTGEASPSATTGVRSPSATLNAQSHASVSGAHSIAAALGPDSHAKANTDGWIVCTAWVRPNIYDPRTWRIVAVRAAKVDGPEGIKPDTWYSLSTGGEFVEVPNV